MLDADPLAVITGDLDHKPELPILLDLLAEAEERAGAPVLRRWVRANGPDGRPLGAYLNDQLGSYTGGTIADNRAYQLYDRPPEN